MCVHACIAQNTIGSRIAVPSGFTRQHQETKGFGEYLRNFPLKQKNSKVLLYNGNEKKRQDVHEAVLDISVGNKDLQQCADAVMRLRAEYFYSTKQYDQLHFNFTNGFNASFDKWRKGYRIKVKGNTATWVKTSEPSDSRKIFDSYLEMVFSYAGTLSLQKELRKKELKAIEPGDVFIVGGSPGHAVIVMDVAIQQTTGKKVFVLAQSYMPAQSIHVLKNFNDTALSPWYHLKEGDVLETPEWDFPAGSLYEFVN